MISNIKKGLMRIKSQENPTDTTLEQSKSKKDKAQLKNAKIKTGLSAGFKTFTLTPTI